MTSPAEPNRPCAAVLPCRDLADRERELRVRTLGGTVVLHFPPGELAAIDPDLINRLDRVLYVAGEQAQRARGADDG